MKMSALPTRTLRDDPSGASSPGTKFLVRGGFIEQLTSGIWVTGHLGLVVRRLIEDLVRQEMNATGSMEVEMPILHPADLWRETGRWDKYKEAGIAFTLNDRKGAGFILAPTAEEPMTHYARRNFTSHRDLPVSLWQMSPKFRDELRPRQGMIRGREFVMKDAYSFDSDEAGMRRSYEAMQAAYRRVFERCGFDFIMVEADSGAIGGSGSAEFMAVTQYGEDTLLVCDSCSYGGNQEKAAARFTYPEAASSSRVRLETPNIMTVAELESFTGLASKQMVKTIVLWVDDDHPVIVSMRGDLEISEVKLANLLGVTSVTTADAHVVTQVTGAPVGFAGPINLFGRTNVPYYFDASVRGLANFLCGGNETDIHYTGVNAGRDFPMPEEWHDLSKATDGLTCSKCKTGVFRESRGIELGHIFQLQQAYSQPMDACFMNDAGERIPFWMGCYGIGVSRMMQAIVEQCHDARGIVWPWPMAPFQVVVIPMADKHMATATALRNDLAAKGIRACLDDRDQRIGAKFTDAELLGFPIQVVVGRAWDSDQKLEIRQRDMVNVPSSFAVEREGSLPSCVMTREAVEAFLEHKQRVHALRA